MKTLFIASCLLVFISITQALQTYHPVEGKCSDLPTLKEYDSQAAPGEWYFQYGSFGQEGDRCSYGIDVERGNRNYVDLYLWDAENPTEKFTNFINDMTYKPDTPGVYEYGEVVGHMVAANTSQYFYYVQCTTKGDETEAIGFFATRSRAMNDEIEQIYQDTSVVLEEKKLLPKMHKINQTACE